MIYRWLVIVVFLAGSRASAEIPWPYAKMLLAQENEKLARRRPQGHGGTYFVICTLYYTPMESGFRADRGFDVTPVTHRGLGGRKYPREFFAAVKKEGFGRITEPVNGRHYIRCQRGGYRFSNAPTGSGSTVLVPRSSAAARRGQPWFRDGSVVTTSSNTVRQVFRAREWKIADTGGGLKRWQIDLYWGEDEPLGPGRFLARPRGTKFEYAFAEAKIKSK